MAFSWWVGFCDGLLGHGFSVCVLIGIKGGMRHYTPLRRLVVALTAGVGGLWVALLRLPLLHHYAGS